MDLESVDLYGKIALITGAAGDLGRATVEAFLAKGARVLAVDLCTGILQLLEKTGVSVFELDVCDAERVETFINESLLRFGRIDVLVNCAGILGPIEQLETISPDDFRKVLDVNLIGSFYTMRATIPSMRRQGSGVIINVGSVSSVIGGVGLSAYSASKHALLGLTRSATQELAGTGIRVLCIGPGPLEGRLMEHMDAKRGSDVAKGVNVVARVPSRRYGRAEEVAAFVAFLASDAASYINGAFLPIDGGRLSA